MSSWTTTLVGGSGRTYPAWVSESSIVSRDVGRVDEQIRDGACAQHESDGVNICCHSATLLATHQGNQTPRWLLQQHERPLQVVCDR